MSKHAFLEMFFEVMEPNGPSTGDAARNFTW
jgi:hypothetical protein